MTTLFLFLWFYAAFCLCCLLFILPFVLVAMRAAHDFSGGSHERQSCGKSAKARSAVPMTYRPARPAAPTDSLRKPDAQVKREIYGKLKERMKHL